MQPAGKASTTVSLSVGLTVPWKSDPALLSFQKALFVLAGSPSGISYVFIHHQRIAMFAKGTPVWACSELRPTSLLEGNLLSGLPSLDADASRVFCFGGQSFWSLQPVVSICGLRAFILPTFREVVITQRSLAHRETREKTLLNGDKAPG